MRRAFDVPDIVMDEHTESALTWQCLDEGPPDRDRLNGPHSGELAAARKIVETLVHMGATGALDVHFARLANHELGDDALVAVAQNKVGEDEQRARVRACLMRLLKYLDDHPWVNPDLAHWTG